MRETDDIDRLFQDSFEGFEMTPPASVKVAIDKQIGGTNRKIWWLLALAFLVLTTPVVLYFAFPKMTPAPILSDNNGKTNSATIQSNSNESVTTTDHLKTPSFKKSTSADSSNSDNNNSLGKTGNTTKTEKVSAKSPKGTLKHKGNAKNVTAKPVKSKTKITKKSNSDSELTEYLPEYVRIEREAEKEKLRKAQLEKERKERDEKLAAISNQSDNPQPKDSILAYKAVKDSTETIASTDTLKHEETTNNNSNNNSNSKPSNWLASLYFGPQFDAWKPNQPYQKLDIQPSFRVSAEINRTLFSGYGVSTGIGYNKTNETYTTSNFTYDSVLHIDSIPQYDSQFPDSIIGYTVVTYTSLDSTQHDYPSTYRTSTIFLPIYATKQFSFGQKWGMLINAGAVFSFYSITTTTPPGTTVQQTNSNGILLSARVQATYKWNDWMFSAGVNGGWYAKPPIGYADFKGSRSFLSPQFGIHYSF